MSQHGRFSFDAANAPAENTQAINHSGVAVCAYQCVGTSEGCAICGLVPHNLCKVFQINLMTDAGARRYYSEIVERTLTPFQEFIAFVVALHFYSHVLFEGIFTAKLVNAH